MLSRQMTKVIDTIKTAFDSGKVCVKESFLSVEYFPAIMKLKLHVDLTLGPFTLGLMPSLQSLTIT